MTILNAAWLKSSRLFFLAAGFGAVFFLSVMPQVYADPRGVQSPLDFQTAPLPISGPRQSCRNHLAGEDAGAQSATGKSDAPQWSRAAFPEPATQPCNAVTALGRESPSAVCGRRAETPKPRRDQTRDRRRAPESRTPRRSNFPCGTADRW